MAYLHSQLATIQKNCPKAIWHFAYKTVFTKLSKDDQFQYNSCICMESQLRVFLSSKTHVHRKHTEIFGVGGIKKKAYNESINLANEFICAVDHGIM